MYKIRKSISVQLIIAVGLFLVAGMFFKYASEVYKDYKVNEEIHSLKNEITQLEEKNNELETYLDYLDTDSYREIVAKRDLNLKKPGEQVFSIKQNDQSSENEEYTYTEDGTYTNIPIYQKWWNMFMK